MFKIKKSIIAIAVVLLVTVLVYARYTAKIFQTPKNEEVTPITNELTVAKRNSDEVPAGAKEVSAVVSYPVPNDGVDTVKFTLVVDKMGVITEAREVNAETNKADDKAVEFSKGLTTVIKGKKLSELKAVDRVGKSSLTTNAFNSAIGKLQAEF